MSGESLSVSAAHRTHFLPPGTSAGGRGGAFLFPRGLLSAELHELLLLLLLLLSSSSSETLTKGCSPASSSSPSLAGGAAAEPLASHGVAAEAPLFFIVFSRSENISIS